MKVAEDIAKHAKFKGVRVVPKRDVKSLSVVGWGLEAGKKFCGC